MFFGKTISALIQEGAIPLLHFYSSGTAYDWSGSGNSGVLSSGARFLGPASALTFPATTDEVTVADAASLRLTAGSIIAVAGQGGFTSQVTNERILSHFAGGLGFLFGVSAVPAIGIWCDGASYKSIGASVIGKRSIGCTFTSGSTPIAYADGLSLGDMSSAVTITSVASDTTIGNYNNSSPTRSPLSCLLLANRILTPTEMAACHAELLAARWPSKQYSIGKRVQAPNTSEAGLVGGWTMRPVNGVVVDAVGAHNGTIYGPVSRQGILGFEQSFDGTDDYINCGNVGSVKTLAFWCRPTTTTEDIIDMDGGTHTVEVTAGTLTATGWAAPTIYVDGAATTSLRAGLLQRVVIATATAFNATALQLGTETTFFDGQIGEVEVFSDEKSAAWVAADYLEGARAVQFKTDWGYNVSPADEGGVTGQQIGGGSSPFRAGDATGRWRTQAEVVDGKVHKVITCMTAGVLQIDGAYFHQATATERAFGSFHAKMYKTDAGVITWKLIGTDFNVAANGYAMVWAADESVVLSELGVGNVVAGGTASHSTWHDFDTTRALAGLFTPYVDAASFGTGTDITTLTSVGMAWDMDAGCKLDLGPTSGGGVVKLLGVVAP